MSISEDDGLQDQQAVWQSTSPEFRGPDKPHRVRRRPLDIAGSNVNRRTDQFCFTDLAKRHRNLKDLRDWRSENCPGQLPTPPPSPEPRFAHQPRDVLRSTHSDPSPPQSFSRRSKPNSTECHRISSQDNGSDDNCKFPTQMPNPKLFRTLDQAERRGRCRYPRRNLFHAQSSQYHSNASWDRFVSARSRFGDLAMSLQTSKPLTELTRAERMLRHKSASPDPFGTLISPKKRGNNRALPNNGRIQPGRSRDMQQTMIGRITIGVAQANPNSSQRPSSAGAVWNVGGGVHMVPSGPVRAVSDGRGGYISGGSNAPMYSARFLRDSNSDDEADMLKNRVAAALDIDRISRMLPISQGPVQARSISTKSIGLKRKRHEYHSESHANWRYGRWLESSVLDAPLLRDDYYCSVLAYCAPARTLAVGLANRVYLWSEDYGVRHPPYDQNGRPGTFVTSLSFSSTDGENCILATARNTGLLCVWSLHDDDQIRFKAQHATPISCVSFKPVPTRRQSEKFCCLTMTEELLVGDESGNVYFYCIEWMTQDQMAVHGWIGSMRLLAKISMHTQQVCGLAWSPDGNFFATGANDNACCLFEVAVMFKGLADGARPLEGTELAGHGPSNEHIATEKPQNVTAEHRAEYSTYLISQELNSPRRKRQLRSRLHQSPVKIVETQAEVLLVGEGDQKHKWVHSAAVKAIAFCPWQRGLIATGGGSNDRAIHFYHIQSGTCLATINVYAQVTSLIWSNTRREIAATFGYAQPEHAYRIAVFSWPECRQVVAIPWSNEMRALLAISYPKGPGETRSHTRLGETWCSRTKEEGCIVIACSDESVKFHEVWGGPSKAIIEHSGLLGGSSILEGLDGVNGNNRETIR